MFFQPSAAELREHQLEQYQLLLEKATTKTAIIFLETELTNLITVSC